MTLTYIVGFFLLYLATFCYHVTSHLGVTVISRDLVMTSHLGVTTISRDVMMSCVLPVPESQLFGITPPKLINNNNNNNSKTMFMVLSL